MSYLLQGLILILIIIIIIVCTLSSGISELQKTELSSMEINKKRYASLLERNNKLSSDYEAFSSKNANSDNGEMTKLSTDIMSLQKQIETLNSQNISSAFIKSLQDQIDVLNKLIKGTDSGDIGAAITALQANLAKLQSSLGTVPNNNNLQAEIDAINSSLTSINSSLSSLQAGSGSAPSSNIQLIGDFTGSILVPSNGTGVVSTFGILRYSDGTSPKFSTAVTTDSMIGTFTVDETGAWSYVAFGPQLAKLKLNGGVIKNVKYTLTYDTSKTVTVTIAIIGPMSSAAFTGKANGSVLVVIPDDNSTLTATGQLTVAGSNDIPQSTFSTVTNTISTSATGVTDNIGSLTMTPNGLWTYTISNTLAYKQHNIFTESFNVYSIGGVPAVITINVNTPVPQFVVEAPRIQSTYFSADSTQKNGLIMFNISGRSKTYTGNMFTLTFQDTTLDMSKLVFTLYEGYALSVIVTLPYTYSGNVVTISVNNVTLYGPDNGDGSAKIWYRSTQ